MWKPKLSVNSGNLNLEKAVQGIIDAGGNVKEEDKGSYIHVVAFLKNRNWHLSYNVYKDGHVDNIHTDADNSLRAKYKI